ncbi:MAG: argininosuccinate synthase [Chloroflexota bacterium]
MAPGAAPAILTEVIIGFSRGVPVSIDSGAGRARGAGGAAQRAGRPPRRGLIDHTETASWASRAARSTRRPSSWHTAHAALEGLTSVQGAAPLSTGWSSTNSRRRPMTGSGPGVYRDLREYVASAQRVVNGEVRLRLDHGTAQVVGRRSDDSLYDRALATYDADDAFDHAAAVGFIRIFGLPLRTEAARHGSAWSWTDPVLSELPVTVTETPAGTAARP